ncbi:unnamed protein product [Bursaphelenchus xylophilus]|uniref:(pine wood nematode) hypothetical protein n=1 Tax=Bursaphelenchus xylophilus TaxID=6326 RepID=A0A1I7S9M9_BURXY|nr:unnamed protein product [Bursaphelenchus xylophilus]CAG9131924.1 unnamed protein product [Bursaphelenchus xylophilus]
MPSKPTDMYNQAHSSAKPNNGLFGQNQQSADSSYAFPKHLYHGNAYHNNPHPSLISNASKTHRSAVSSSYFHHHSDSHIVNAGMGVAPPPQYCNNYNELIAKRDALIEKAERARLEYEDATFQLRNLSSTLSQSSFKSSVYGAAPGGDFLGMEAKQKSDSVYLGFPHHQQTSNGYYTTYSSNRTNYFAQNRPESSGLMSSELFGGIPCTAESFRCDQSDYQ